ncbi:MAG: mevalonate kinase [Alkalispirochaetaceae bacterium]
MGVGYEAIAPGKLLLFGEHAAVYGYPALGMALPVRLTLRIDFEELPEAPHVAHSGAADVRDSREAIEERWELPHILDEHPHILSDFFLTVERTAAELLPTLEIERYRGVVTLSSQIPIASGFGSSAAVCACVSRILLAAESSGDISNRETGELQRDELSGNHGLTRHPSHFMPDAPHPHRLWTLANRLERFFHGTPSGIDTGLAVLGGTQAFYFPEDRAENGLPKAYPRAAFPGWLVAGSVPRSRGTKALVASVREQVERDPTAMGRLRELGEIALEAAELLEEREPGRVIGETALRAERAQAILGSFGLSVAPVERALERGKAAGAPGGKMSGAGGGGAFYLVCRDQNEARRVFEAVAEILGPEGLVTIPPQQIAD